MTARVRTLLERLPRRTRWVLTAQPSNKHPRGDGQISERRLLRSLKRVLKRLGLPGHLHTTRHALISRSLLAGIPEAVVREWVGHVDEEIIRRYTHVAAEQSQSFMRLAEAHQVRRSGKDKSDVEGKVDETQSGVSAQIQPTAPSRPECEGAK